MQPLLYVLGKQRHSFVGHRITNGHAPSVTFIYNFSILLPPVYHYFCRDPNPVDGQGTGQGADTEGINQQRQYGKFKYSMLTLCRRVSSHILQGHTSHYCILSQHIFYHVNVVADT